MDIIMEPKKKRNNPYFDDTIIDSLKVTSTNDCTGLMPSLPQSEAEVDSYTELYDIPNSKQKNEK